MLGIPEQVDSGRLVCPKSHHRLVLAGSWLETIDQNSRYPLVNGVPVMLSAEKQADYLSQAKGKMAEEYAAPRSQPLRQFGAKLAANDYRSQSSRTAFKETIEDQPESALCVAVGGGPFHLHPKLVNLNIGLFSNVHVVGDAYELPYAAGAVDAFHIEAVLEHLAMPGTAVAEMYRALRPGGQVLAVTPFMQHFHAYPNHFQNYTQIGQERLLQTAGFEVVSSGVCVGPTYAITSLNYRYITEYVRLPLLRQLLLALSAAAALVLRPLDNRLNLRDNAHILASTTYVHARKPD